MLGMPARWSHAHYFGGSSVIPFLAQTSNRLDEIDVLNATGDYGLEMAMFDIGNTITRYSISPLADRQLLDQISTQSAPAIIMHDEIE